MICFQYWFLLFQYWGTIHVWWSKSHEKGVHETGEWKADMWERGAWERGAWAKRRCGTKEKGWYQGEGVIPRKLAIIHIRVPTRYLPRDMAQCRWFSVPFQVTMEDCLMALDDTQWHVHKATKYIKLKQLLAAEMGDVERCKRALLTCHWDVDQAASILLTHTTQNNSTSPDCIDV